jgi:aspartate 1-decarboxylase
MFREFLKSKLHRATITESNLNYSGSITIDEELMQTAGFENNEKVAIFNIDNGARFETYTMKGKFGSRIIGLNGAAARLGAKGDKLIIVAYCFLSEEEISKHKAKMVVLGSGNEIERIVEK